MSLIMKKICILFFLLIYAGYQKLYAEEKDNKEISVFLDLSRNNLFYNELRKYYTKVELRYIRGENYTNGYGTEYFILERLTYYGIKNDVEYFLGYITKNGIFDKNSNILREVIVPEYAVNMGLSSGTLVTPWTPSYALKYTDKTKYPIGNAGPFAFMKIDFSKNSLMVYLPEY